MAKPKTDRPPGRPPVYDEPRADLQISVPVTIKDALVEQARREHTSITRLVVRVLERTKGVW
jgi:hypothetical protein